MDTSVAQIKKLQTNVEETISLEPTESSTIVENAIEATVELPPQAQQPEQPEQPQAQQPEQPQAQQQPVVQQRNNDIMNAVVTV